MKSYLNIPIVVILVQAVSACVSIPRVTYVAPPGVVVEGEGVTYPNPEAKNVAAVANGALIGSKTSLRLKCSDGTVEEREFSNDSMYTNDISLALASGGSGAVAGLLSVYFLSDNNTRLGSSMCVSALGLCSVSALSSLFFWRPSEAVTVDVAGGVCRPKLQAATDSDGDGLTDELDKCPKEPETVNNVNDDDGCPDEGASLVAIKAGKIEIGQKVFFDTEKAVIQDQSFGVLDQVAALLKNHPELKQVRVEGHTDSVGDATANMALSQARADAVKSYLVGKGITAARLDAKGFGVTRPIADNGSTEGREQNRRVEFVIVTTP